MFRDRRSSNPLEGVGLACTWPSDVRERLAPHTDVLRPAAGTRLARRGTSAHEVVVVVRGEVHASRDGTLHGRITPGGSFGAHETAGGADHPYDYVAGEGTELRVVEGRAFRGVADRLPDLTAPSPVGPAQLVVAEAPAPPTGRAADDRSPVPCLAHG